MTLVVIPAVDGGVPDGVAGSAGVFGVTGESLGIQRVDIKKPSRAGLCRFDNRIFQFAGAGGRFASGMC